MVSTSLLFLYWNESKSMQKLIIGVSGEIASGKDTVNEYIVEKYHAHKLGFSDILRDILDRLYMPHTRYNMATLAEALRTNFKESILAEAIIQSVQKINSEYIVIDGIRKIGELECVKQLANFHYLYVDASLHTRYERIIKRTENPDDQTKTFEEFAKDNEHAADNVIPQLKKYANSVIDNNGSLEELYAQVDIVMNNLKT